MRAPAAPRTHQPTRVIEGGTHAAVVVDFAADGSRAIDGKIDFYGKLGAARPARSARSDRGGPLANAELTTNRGRHHHAVEGGHKDVRADQADKPTRAKDDDDKPTKRLFMDSLFGSVEEKLRKEFSGADSEIEALKDFLRDNQDLDEVIASLGPIMEDADEDLSILAAMEKRKALVDNTTAVVEAAHEAATEHFGASDGDSEEGPGNPGMMDILNRGMELALGTIDTIGNMLEQFGPIEARVAFTQTTHFHPGDDDHRGGFEMETSLEIEFRSLILPTEGGSGGDPELGDDIAPDINPDGTGTTPVDDTGTGGSTGNSIDGAPIDTGDNGTPAVTPDPTVDPTLDPTAATVDPKLREDRAVLDNLFASIEDALGSELGDVKAEAAELRDFLRNIFKPSGGRSGGGGGGGSGSGASVSPVGNFIAQTESLVADAQSQAEDHFSEQPKTLADHQTMQTVLDRGFELIMEKLQELAAQGTSDPEAALASLDQLKTTAAKPANLPAPVTESPPAAP